MSSVISEVDGNVQSSNEKISKEKLLNGYLLPEERSKEMNKGKNHEFKSKNTSVKNLLQTWVTEQYGKLLKAFSVFDTQKTCSISVKDFRSTIEKLFFPLEDRQFEDILSQVLRYPDGTVCYHNFLNQFCKLNQPKVTESRDFQLKPRSVTPISVSPLQVKNGVDEMKQLLSEKFSKNVSAVLKAFHFYDYNRNGKINKSNFRKVLEKFDFKLTNRQFERLWQTENFCHSSMLDYNDFLQKLITSGNISNSSSGNINVPLDTDYWDPKTGIVIKPTSSWPPYQKVFQLTASDEKEILRRLELRLREVICRHHYRIRKAFEDADPKLQGFVSIDDMRQILETYMSPMSDEVFGHLMKCLGIQPEGLIAWQVFLTNFQCPKEKTSFKTVEYKNIPKEIIPLKNTNTYVDAKTVMFHLGQTLIFQYGSLENAFRKLDHRGRGWLTRLDIEAEVKKLYYCLNEREYQEVCVMLDPEHMNRIYPPKFIEVLKGITETPASASVPQRIPTPPRSMPREKFQISESIPQYIPTPPKTMSREKFPVCKSIPQCKCLPAPPKTMSWENVEEILKEHLVSKCEEIKNKIIMESTKEKGFLSSKSLKNILDTIVFPIDDEHFQSLLTKYATPQKDGLIDCQQFFEKLIGSQNLFVVPIPRSEEVVTAKCCMQPTETNIYPCEKPHKSFLVTAEKFPYVLAEKSQTSGQTITKNYLIYRKAGKDILTLETLENVLKKFEICISGSELNKLWKRCDPEEKGYAFYEDFLESCGLEEVYRRNNEVGSLGYILIWKVVGEKRPSTAQTTSTINKITTKSFDGISPEFTLREMILRSPHDILKSLSNLDVNKTGKILVSDVRRVLIGYGLRMTDDQWNHVMNVIGTEENNILNLNRFIDYIKNNQEPTCSYDSKKVYTLKEVEEMVRQVVMDRKSEFLAAFREADFNSLNAICREDFENILYKFRIRMDNEMFSRFWSILPLNKHNNLIYKDFIAWFSNPNRFSTEVQCCRPQCSRPHEPERPKTAAVIPLQQAPPETLMVKPLAVLGHSLSQPELKLPSEESQQPCETDEKAFVDKISQNLGEVLTKLNYVCGNEDTSLPPEVLKSVLESVAHPINDDIFNSMVNRCVAARLDGFVNYQQFLMRLLPWRSDNGRSLAGEMRRVNPSISAEKNQPYNFVTAKELPALLAKLTQNHYHSVTKGYLTFSKAGKDILTMTTLKNFLKAFNISMSENEINILWRQCDPEYKRYITYEEFLERCGLEEVYKGSSETGSSKYVLIWKLMDKEPYIDMNEENTDGLDYAPDIMAGDNCVCLNPEQYLRESLLKMPLEIWKAISDLGRQKSDLVPAANLQNLLASYGIKMTDNEWKRILQPFLNENGLINIKLFISNLLYGKTFPSVDNEGELSSKDLKEIEKIISTHSNEFLAACKEADYAFLNTISQETFQNILKKLGIDMDQAKFLKFWSLLPVNEYGNLMYLDFLKWINARKVKPYMFRRPSTTVSRAYEPWKPPGPHLPNAVRTSGEILPLEVHTARRRRRSAIVNAAWKKCHERPSSFASTKLVNAEQVEHLIKDVILSHWKQIQKKCRLEDPDCTGCIRPEKFKEILLHYMKNLDDEKFTKLKEKFDIKGDGTLAYKDLIRYFVMGLKPTRVPHGQHRLLRKPEKDEFDTVPTEGLLGEALKRLRQCVIKNWRMMRRSFQVADPSKSDRVDIITFRQILKAQNVNLTEEEFFQIMSFYDKDFSASINYNSFLRAFLQNW